MKEGLPALASSAPLPDSVAIQSDAASTLKTMAEMVFSADSMKMTFAAVCAALMVGPHAAFAQAVTNADPSAPLTGLSTARTKAQSSNLDVTHVQTTGNNVLSILMILGGVLGLGGALASGFKLYKNIQAGDQGRESNSGLVIALIVSSLLTIICIIVGVVTIYATGNS